MRARRCRGLSLVELLVGTAIGLLVVAAASTQVVHHVRDSRALAIETRLMQELRTASDIVARDLRRAGYWAGAGSGVASQDGSPGVANPYAAASPEIAASDTVRLRYSRDAVENDSVDSNEQFGFRLRGGAIEMQLGDANWQSLTDARTLQVTEFSVEPRIEESSLAEFCAGPCAAGDTACPPRQQTRRFAVRISGRSAFDPAIRRSVRAEARVRNGTVVGSCAGSGS
ncbi:MAG TPA: prepilin-type N-terminal cleavage/methylation domain-containing protein [Caldimonas sp.]|nr:prepilin-type N-terminal cleavage/methylation domain-containing protein [Caldimonas sp.]